jgi:hypothetical protein
MPIKKWCIQYVVMASAIFLLPSGVQYLKGRSANYSLEFVVLWSLVSASIFLITQVSYFRNNIACQVCNDLPGTEPNAANETNRDS